MTGDRSSVRAGTGAVHWVLLGAAAFTVVLLVVFVLTMESDERIDPEAVLPEPQPPQTRALTAPGGRGIGWTWVNPLPRWMPTWYGVDVATESLVALVGFGGGAARFDDGRMYYWPTGTDRSLYGVAWSSTDEAIVVGDEGTLLVLRRQGEPVVLDAGTDASLRDVVALSSSEAWVVGDEGTLLRLDAHEPTVVDSGTELDLLAIHRRGDTLWAVGEAGVVLRIDDGVVRRVQSGTEMTLRAVGGCASGDLYAAGDEGRLLRLDPEGRWEPVSIEEREPLSGVACDGERAVVTGLRGGVLLVAGKRTVRLPTGTEASLHAVASSASGQETWVVGEGGRLMKVVEDHLLTLTAGPTVPLRDMSTLAGALFAVGEWGRILRQRDAGFEQMPSPTKSALAGVTRHGDDRLLAVGDYGAIVEIEYEEARLIESPAGSSWRDVVSDGHAVLGVGTEGSVLRGTPGAFEVTRVGDVETLWALSGTPGSALAVGDGGAVVELTEAGVRRIDCDVDVGLRGVWRSSDGSWAVGERGVILRIDRSECVVERPPDERAPTLNAVGRGPEGRPVAVGDDGVALDRSDDGTWARANLDVAGVDLRAVLYTPRDVFLAGEGGVVVRHITLE